MERTLRFESQQELLGQQKAKEEKGKPLVEVARNLEARVCDLVFLFFSYFPNSNSYSSYFQHGGGEVAMTLKALSPMSGCHLKCLPGRATSDGSGNGLGRGCHSLAWRHSAGGIAVN